MIRPVSAPSRSRRSALIPFALLAAVAVAVRLVPGFLPLRLTTLSVVGAVLGAVVTTAQVLVLGLLVRRPDRARPVSGFLIGGVLLIVLAQVASSVVSAAIAIGLTGDVVSTSATVTVSLVLIPALGITSAFGAVLVPIGLLMTFRGSTPRGVAVAVVALAIVVWLALAALFAVQYLILLSARQGLLIGTIVTAGVGALGWVGTALVSLDRRADAPESLGPLAVGSTLIAFAGMAGTTVVQVVTADPLHSRDTPFLAFSVVAAGLVALGWVLVLLAAWRGLVPDATPVQPSGGAHR